MRTRRSGKLGLALALLGLLLFAPQGVYAQIDTGSISGTISDASGAVVPAAKVSLTNEGTNLTIMTTSKDDGGYIFTPVKIGTYTVAAEAAGFQKVSQSHLTVNIDQHLLVNLSLRPGEVTQTIEVTAAPALLQTQTAAVGQVVGTQSVNNLPLNGRNFTFLAQVVAGVNTPQADTRGNAASGAFAANGLRTAQNNYLLDGIDNNSDTVDFLNGTNFVVLPPVDAIQEFKVQTNNYSAQYGRSGAAILNATIKSGTNNLHGDFFEFFRNNALDAADFFENSGGNPIGELRLNQFGGTIGGPIVIPHVYNGRNKLFFFGDYEGLRRRQGSVFTTSVPTDLERTSGYTNFAELITGQAGSGTHTENLGRTVPYGTVFDPATTRAVTKGGVDPVTGLVATATGFVRDPFYTGGSVRGITNFTGYCATAATCMLNQIPAGRLYQNAINLLNLSPVPTGSSLFANFTGSPPLIETRDAFDTRVDFNQSDRNQIFARFSYVNDPEFIPGPFSGIPDGGAFQQGDQSANSIQAALSWTHTFSPTIINEARLGENRLGTHRFGPVATQFGIPAKYGISNSIPQCCENGGLPAFGISGLNTLGSNAFLPSDEVSQTTQVTDNFTKIYGNHTFKAGLEYQHVKYSTLQPPWSHGQYNYDGVYTNIPDGSNDNTGPAQFVILPCPGPTPGGAPTGCPSVPSAIANVGGSDAVFTSNISLTDDGKNYWGTYFEDDWKVNSKLTLNLGLRWDWFGQTFEHYGAQANWVPGAPGTGGGAQGTGAQYLIPAHRNTGLSTSFTTLMAQDGMTIVSSNNRGLGQSQKDNFSPRIGFAYQFSPKLVMRGGYGIFYGGFENRGFSPNIGENYPFQFNFSFFNPNGEAPISATHFPSFAGTPCENAFMFESGFDCTPLQTSVVQAQGLSLRGIQYNYKTPYTQGYNLMLQYELTPSMTVSMGYVGNVVHHLEVFPGANEVSQILLPNVNIYATSAPGKGLYLPYPDFGAGGSYAATEGNSHYNSLQMSVEKRYAEGLNFLGTYTYSGCRSDSGDLLNGGSIGYRAPYIPGFGIQADYGNCDFLIRNVFHFSGGYELPFGKGKRYASGATGFANQLISGWSTQWIFTAEGGQPQTLTCPVSTAAGVTCNDLLIPGVDPHGSGAPDHFYNAAAFTQPCAPAGFTQATRCATGMTGIGLLGGASSQTTGPGIVRLDLSFFKQFHLS